MLFRSGLQFSRRLHVASFPFTRSVVAIAYIFPVSLTNAVEMIETSTLSPDLVRRCARIAGLEQLQRAVEERHVAARREDVGEERLEAAGRGVDTDDGETGRD